MLICSLQLKIMFCNKFIQCYLFFFHALAKMLVIVKNAIIGIFLELKLDVDLDYIMLLSSIVHFSVRGNSSAFHLFRKVCSHFREKNERRFISQEGSVKFYWNLPPGVGFVKCSQKLDSSRKLLIFDCFILTCIKFSLLRTPCKRSMSKDGES